MTWRGDLKPVLDAYLEQLAPLESGFTSGRVLSAEEIPGVLDLGAQWLGDLRDRMLASMDERPGAIVATPVLRHLEEVRTAMGTADSRRIRDAVRRLRRAADEVTRRGRDAEREHGAFSEGRRIADGLMRSHIGDFSRPVSIAEINRRNREFHAVRDATPHLDSSGCMRLQGGDAIRTSDSRETAIRDAQHALAQAASLREQLAAMNRAAKALWSGYGDPASITTDMLRRAPAPNSIAEMNQRNRAFWASRS